jgi:hypothetical protein
MAAAGNDGPRDVVYWRAALSVCADCLSRCRFAICGLFDLPPLAAPNLLSGLAAPNGTPPPYPISHAPSRGVVGHSRLFQRGRDILLVSLFLVNAGIHTAPLINILRRLHWAGDNPGANLIGFIAGSTFFVIVFSIRFARIGPTPFALMTISRSLIGATRSHAQSAREFFLKVALAPRKEFLAGI